LKKLIFIIFITLFIQAEDNISSIYKVEGYNSVSSTQEIIEDNNSSVTLTKESQESDFFKFREDYDIALKQAKIENKYIFLLITEEFCQWCEKLMDIVFQDNKIVEKLKQDYISVVVDRNKGFYPSNIGITGVPSVFIIDAKTGKIIKSMVGYQDVNYYMQVFKDIENNGIYKNR